MTKPSICSVEIPWREPLDAFVPLADQPWALALISGGEQSAARWSILCAEPDQTLTVPDHGALEQLGQQLQTPQLESSEHGFPFVGGWAGLLGYELGARLENIDLLPDQVWPDLGLAHYPCCALFDHQSGRAWALGPNQATALAFEKTLGTTKTDLPHLPVLEPISCPETDGEILERIERVLTYIQAGDIFQANLSRAFRAQLREDVTPYGLFRQMAVVSAAPFCGYFRLSQSKAVLSNSPERFVRASPDGQVETCPIKGTRPRGKTPAEDQKLAAELLQSTKDRAENLMIVDLMRNDLSRVCQPGTVQVPELFALQSYANVHHLVSMVSGRLAPGVGPVELLQASFAAGSITGAPKIRAMQIIAELEQAHRGPYCGALGYISNDGAMDFNVNIRTLQLDANPDGRWNAVFRAGGGIVADSTPEAELAEINDKAAIFQKMAAME